MEQESNEQQVEMIMQLALRVTAIERVLMETKTVKEEDLAAALGNCMLEFQKKLEEKQNQDKEKPES